MRLLLCCTLLITSLLPSNASRIELALIEFASERDPAQLAAALTQTDLTRLASGTSTEPSSPILQGGSVLYAQSFPLAEGQSVRLATRLEGSHAHLEAALRGGKLMATVRLAQGDPRSPLFSHSKTYKGDSPIRAGGPPVILLLRNETTRNVRVLRGTANVSRGSRATLLTAQLKQ